MAHNFSNVSKSSSHCLSLHSLVYFHCYAVNAGQSGGTAEGPLTQEDLLRSSSEMKWRKETQKEVLCPSDNKQMATHRKVHYTVWNSFSHKGSLQAWLVQHFKTNFSVDPKTICLRDLIGTSLLDLNELQQFTPVWDQCLSQIGD